MRVSILLSLLAFTTLACHAEPTMESGPQAASRPHLQNYKDMVLATCIANAYQKSGDAAVDAGSSVSALRDWIEYDMDSSPDAIKALIDSYLSRDYHNPIAESEVKGVRFDLLKCLDLYHSEELERQTRTLVIDPEKKDH